MQNTAPPYKEEILAELRARLGRKAIPSVAARCGYSDRYVRYWFSSARKIEGIQQAATRLLDELVAEEKAAATALQEV